MITPNTTLKRWIIAGALTVGIAVLAASLGPALLSGPELSKPTPGGPWEAAGVHRMRTTTTSAAVLVVATSRQDVIDADGATRFTRRLGKIAWRSGDGSREITVSVTFEGASRELHPTVRWTAAQALAAWGPARGGRMPADPAGTYAHPPDPMAREAAAQWLWAVALDAAERVAPGKVDPKPAVIPVGVGICGRETPEDTPITRAQNTPIKVTVTGDPERLLPDIADGWARLGLTNDDNLDTGMNLVTARWADRWDLGGITAQAAEHTIWLMPTTGCPHPAPPR
ncbi:hypothetical protein AB0M43_24095 [Longispora sp. NPDC051575]|uniref:hypothetical protein n=1 Tax=Longispora sp. NPDC051575 TaxID=3154943 RepID=UPI0034339803